MLILSISALQLQSPNSIMLSLFTVLFLTALLAPSVSGESEAGEIPQSCEDACMALHGDALMCSINCNPGTASVSLDSAIKLLDMIFDYSGRLRRARTVLSRMGSVAVIPSVSFLDSFIPWF